MFLTTRGKQRHMRARSATETGLRPRNAKISEPEGNGVAQRFIRTLKESLLLMKAFDTVEELRIALQHFARRYNETWLVAGHRCRTPAQVWAMQLQSDKHPIDELFS